LLAGEAQVGNPKSEIRNPKLGTRRWTAFIAPALVLISLVLAVLATQLGGEAQAGAFMGAGAAMLDALLIFIAGRLKAKSSGLSTTGLAKTAFRNAGRNVGRSVTTIALMASASFLIVAVSAFQLDPSDEGVGGFDYLAESSEPILADLNSAEARKQLLRQDAKKLGTTILSSPCPATTPVAALISRTSRDAGGDAGTWTSLSGKKTIHFTAASTAKTLKRGEPCNFTRLPRGSGMSCHKNTAMYSLSLWGSAPFEFDYGKVHRNSAWWVSSPTVS
jgi:hypothetical protein